MCTLMVFNAKDDDDDDVDDCDDYDDDYDIYFLALQTIYRILIN